MTRKRKFDFKKWCICMLVLLSVGMLVACEQRTAQSTEETKQQSVDGTSAQEKTTEKLEIFAGEEIKKEEEGATAQVHTKESSASENRTGKDSTEKSSTGNDNTGKGDTAEENGKAENTKAESADTKDAKAEAMKAKFGETCIAEQTFEAKMSEYNGKVYFVPFAPAKEGSERSDFCMQIMQNGKVLTDIPAYVPDDLKKEIFTSLDAVSFYDVNYDGNTDIVVIETYGKTRFAAIYYGYGSDSEEYYRPYFVAQEQLSETVSKQAEQVSVAEIRSLLTDGRKNGKFSNYQEAYRAVSKLYQLEGLSKDGYDLIYFDEDDVPELVVAANGYWVSLYTYQDGTVYMLMDHSGYGVMGNAGYEYVPKKNSLRNYNTDYAGALLYTTYMGIGSRHTMDSVAHIQTYNFDDVNKNGILDENEIDSVGKYSVSYIDGREVTEEECTSYDVGDYVFMEGKMSFEALQAKLK